MTPRYIALSQRISQEIKQLEIVFSVIQKHWQKARSGHEDRDAYLNSVALNLHGFYSGLERIFEFIASELDGGKLGGADWHRELLKQMVLDIPKVRPPVLGKEAAASLDEYRKFRHRIRNIYAVELDPVLMANLLDPLKKNWDQIRSDLLDFLVFLENLSKE